MNIAENLSGAEKAAFLLLTMGEDFRYRSDIKMKIMNFEEQIDQMVYKLYGLTPEEVEIVEGQK